MTTDGMRSERGKGGGGGGEGGRTQNKDLTAFSRTRDWNSQPLDESPWDRPANTGPLDERHAVLHVHLRIRLACRDPLDSLITVGLRPVGLVVKASASSTVGLGSIPTFGVDPFPGSSRTSDLELGTPVAPPPGPVIGVIVSVPGLVGPGVSML